VRKKKKTTLPNTPGRQAAQAKYNSKPQQVKNREERNRARALLMREGKVKKGDGKDVDHISGTAAGNVPSNLRVLSASVNRKYNRRSKKTIAPKKF
jgi:hypothetical protein